MSRNGDVIDVMVICLGVVIRIGKYTKEMYIKTRGNPGFACQHQQ